MYAEVIASELGLRVPQVRAALGRRDRHEYLAELDERRAAILKSIDEQGKLTPELKAALDRAETKQAVEDLYLPYKPRRRTCATIAAEKGLLHAVAMGLFSLVLWVLLNLFPGAALRAESWDVGTAYVAGLVLLQIAAAAVGGRMGSRDARRASAGAS
ncbi:MAG TPA: Tex-like N-terminal domain-containing protein [Longimicrobium sp.]|jgi:hypothetical protein|nr:Tex-like N-terminal domain-containing protein [Longimicrobium sp.]